MGTSGCFHVDLGGDIRVRVASSVDFLLFFVCIFLEQCFLLQAKSLNIMK